MKKVNVADFIGLTLERINVVPSDTPKTETGYKSIVLCFGNGKSIHFDAEMHLCKEGVLPVIRSRDGDWEMIKAAPECEDEGKPVDKDWEDYLDRHPGECDRTGTPYRNEEQPKIETTELEEAIADEVIGVKVSEKGVEDILAAEESKKVVE